MHIPDGYLSPATCAALYASATPFWYAALRRVRALMHTRAVPVLALVAAFCFVIMMFNVPLPGGTSGHAVGIGLAVALLGPWASITSISTALAIQALLFGDGGITAFGANSFNMAIVGSLVAWFVYSGVAARSPLASRRRAVAAALAGYAGINAAAFCASIEFGIQPLLYRDAAGAPLYAPYPLGIALPAMMIGHLTVAGFAEAIASGGVIAFAQRSDPALLRRAEQMIASGLGPALKPLGALLLALLVLTPLGLLASGTAWGEWPVSDFNDPAARQQIAAATRNLPAPQQAPQGMARLASAWRAPFQGYTAAWVSNARAGYLLSAVAGTGLMLAVAGAIVWRGRRRRGARPAPARR